MLGLITGLAVRRARARTRTRGHSLWDGRVMEGVLKYRGNPWTARPVSTP